MAGGRGQGAWGMGQKAETYFYDASCFQEFEIPPYNLGSTLSYKGETWAILITNFNYYIIN